MRPFQLLRRSFAALPLITLLASCQKEDDSAPITELTLRDELTFSIIPGNGTELDLTTSYDAQNSINALLQERGFSPGQLRDVRIEDARAVMIEPVPAWATIACDVSYSCLNLEGSRSCDHCSRCGRKSDSPICANR